ncbi:MAG: hypothetical protein Q8912_16270 [Bacillota bacterium]|nr:hypothetical protein [Bacillota bacterium]
MAKVKTSISLDKKVYEKLADEARRQRRSFSGHIEYIASKTVKGKE